VIATATVLIGCGTDGEPDQSEPSALPLADAGVDQPRSPDGSDAALCDVAPEVSHDGDGAVCASFVGVVGVHPLSILFLVDRSDSMNDATAAAGTKWELARAAVLASLATPELAAAEVALTYFPRTSGSGMTTCSEADYVTPDIEFAPVASAQPGIAASLAAQAPGGTSPDGPALAGAIAHARSWWSANGSGGLAPFVVLVSDGYPTDCAPQDDSGLAQIAAAGAAASPSIATLVVMAGWNVSDLQLLDGIAMAGGHIDACLIDPPGLPAPYLVQLTSYLKARAALPSPCTWTVPTPEAGSAAWASGSVSLSLAGTSQQVGRVDDASACDASAGGWYYDADVITGATPSQLTLCPATCAIVQTAPGGSTLSFDVSCGP
jgi:hypothetical protein